MIKKLKELKLKAIIAIVAVVTIFLITVICAIYSAIKVNCLENQLENYIECGKIKCDSN